MQSRTFRALGMSGSITNDMGLVNAKFTGLLTKRSMIEAAAWLARTCTDWGNTSALCIDFREAMFLTTCEEICALLPDPDSPVSRPCALVVKQEDVGLFLAHAWNAALVGIVRVVFTKTENAQRWLAGQRPSRMPPLRAGSASRLATQVRMPRRVRRGSRSHPVPDLDREPR